MDFFKAILAIFVLIGLAIMLGKLDHQRHPELYAYGWILAIVILLLVRFCL